MDEGALLFGDAYENVFSPRHYLDKYYKAMHSDSCCANPIVLDHLKRFFAIIGSSDGKRLLELGCGPCIINVAHASDKFTEIVLSDYAECNLKEINLWLKADQDAFDWSPILASLATGNSMAEVEQHLRSRISKLVRGDVTKEGVLEHDCGQFDAVVSCLCLETACESPEKLSSAINRVSLLLVPRGHLVLVTVLEQSFWTFAGKRYFSLPLKEDQLLQLLHHAGFTVLQKARITRQPRLTSDCTGLLVSLLQLNA